MSLQEFLARIGPSGRLRQRMLEGILPQNDFTTVFEREQAKAGGNRHQVSLVSFKAVEPDGQTDHSPHLAQVLASRIRTADEAGWMDEQHIGVLLPYTPHVGAHRLAEDVHRLMSARTSATISYTVTTFPPESVAPAGRNEFDDLVAEPGDRRKMTAACQDSDNTESGDPRGRSLHKRMPAWKRCMDVVGALSALIVCSPLLLLSAAIIKIVSPGPIIFKQRRVGYRGRQFDMWKLRTMKANNDASVHKQHLAELINGGKGSDCDTPKPMTKLEDSGRIIPFGNLLRLTGIDEVPQLVNVLRGEMSLVGPRPAIPYEVEHYAKWHKDRINAVPGMTGLWQVSGKNRLTFDRMVCLDIQYWRHLSPWMDMQICLRTPLAIATQIKDNLHRTRNNGKEG